MMSVSISTASPVAGERARDIHVLVVDDEESNLRLMARVLQRDHYRVTTAKNGVDALQAIRTRTPDLVLLDLTMPVMDGLAVCRHVRADFRTRGLPIIMLTGRGTSVERTQGYRAGADDYIVKPFDLDELKARMEGALQRRRWDLYRHPLTGLPGSPGIEEEVRRRIGLPHPWAFVYIDIDHFKAYNDAYGYEAGDLVIKRLSGLLLDSTTKTDLELPFPGHVGGDDFVLISSIAFMRAELPYILGSFDALRESLYTPEDFARKRIRTKDRLGREQEFPLVSVSAAVVSTETRKITHYARLIEIASELKQYVKRQDHGGQSLLMWDRRTDTYVP